MWMNVDLSSFWYFTCYFHHLQPLWLCQMWKFLYLQFYLWLSFLLDYMFDWTENFSIYYLLQLKHYVKSETCQSCHMNHIQKLIFGFSKFLGKFQCTWHKLDDDIFIKRDKNTDFNRWKLEFNFIHDSFSYGKWFCVFKDVIFKWIPEDYIDSFLFDW